LALRFRATNDPDEEAVTDTGNISSRLAMPGDPDLDLDVHAITVTSAVAVTETREVLLHLRGGHGWWVDAATAELVATDVCDSQVSMRLPDMTGDVWTSYIGLLERWRAEGTLLRMISAPGRMSLLIENPESFIPVPRRPDPESPTT
jgi:hypothetical protein